jgi:hypothetical protein
MLPWTLPLLLAAAVTLANAAKPVLIDGTAYLAFARQIAAHPLDPYGFMLYWSSAPLPAFEVLAPPVVPYWLALGIKLFGERPRLLELWMFPFVWLLAWSVRDLLRRFAAGAPVRGLLALIMLSPAVLPTVNLMLDVPALAFGLASVALLARAGDRARARGAWPLAAAAGLVAALAIQTKYNMLVVLPVLGWYGLTHGRRALALSAAAVAVAVAGFAGWELFVAAAHGQSHFLFQTVHRTAGTSLSAKLALVSPLVAHLGCLGAGAGLVAAGALGISRRRLAVAAGVWLAAFLLIAAVPYRWALIAPGHSLFVKAFWRAAGLLVLSALAACAVLLGRRRGPAGADGRFLAGWLLLELAGTLATTPFPAARRVIGLAVVGALLAARAAGRFGRLHPRRRPAPWMLGFGIATGVAIAALDTVDAYPEKVCATRAAAVSAAAASPAGSTTWYTGHWGFQYYAERAGMRPVVPGRSTLARGDRLVLPEPARGRAAGRPDGATAIAPPPPGTAAPLAELTCDDPLSGQTLPDFYGRFDPVVSRDHPRLQVIVYAIEEAWTP